MKAFEFDDDHLYSFFMDGKKWSNHSIVAPFDSSGHPVASDVTIGGAGLYAGQRFMYLFDYGDEWQFTITVTHINEAATDALHSSLIERQGSGPEQYFYY